MAGVLLAGLEQDVERAVALAVERGVRAPAGAQEGFHPRHVEAAQRVARVGLHRLGRLAGPHGHGERRHQHAGGEAYGGASAQRHTACLGSAPPAAARALSAAAEANRQRPRPRSAARLRSFPFKSRPSEIPRNLFITAPGRIEQGDRDAA
ncbi:MAG: hypothetical protein WDN45_03535 [Caulobacteraceae bacterium]